MSITGHRKHAHQQVLLEILVQRGGRVPVERVSPEDRRGPGEPEPGNAVERRPLVEQSVEIAHEVDAAHRVAIPEHQLRRRLDAVATAAAVEQRAEPREHVLVARAQRPRGAAPDPRQAVVRGVRVIFGVIKAVDGDALEGWQLVNVARELLHHEVLERRVP